MFVCLKHNFTLVLLCQFWVNCLRKCIYVFFYKKAKDTYLPLLLTDLLNFLFTYINILYSVIAVHINYNFITSLITLVALNSLKISMVHSVKPRYNVNLGLWSKLVL